MAKSGSGTRTVRSFVRRTGRLTAAQNRALEELWPRFGIDFPAEPLDLDRVFGRSAQRIVEIGFGDGQTLVQDAARHPQQDFLGVEVHTPGIGRCLIAARDLGLGNLRVINHDAVEVLRQLPEQSLDRVNLYFPDPWPKKRHHKRRLVQPAFLELVASRLVNGGRLHIATDWENYAAHIDAVIAQSPSFELCERRLHTEPAWHDRQATKFERRGLRLGHSIWDWRLARI